MSKFHFGVSSQARLQTLHPKWQEILNRAMLKTEEDFCIICGHRGIEAQNEAYYSGKSKAKFGQSNHNYYPSMAVDLAPYPIDWQDNNSFERLAKHIFYCADTLGVKIKWGGEWSFQDMSHFELSID